jgi:D-glycerate 3-kinase
MGRHPSVIEQVGLPLLARLRQLLAAGRRPVLALNGPVGAGKTTLTQVLQTLARRDGVRLGVASIDDFYLPWHQRQQAMAGNPFGFSRVPPGSHDLALLLESLRAWRGGAAWCRPRFDKALRQGQGDRAAIETAPCDALLLEGWLLGCRSLDLSPGGAGDRGGSGETAWWRQALEKATPALSAQEVDWLPRWDGELKRYEPVWELLDAIAVLRPSNWRWPRRWRFQAEARQRRRARLMKDAGGWLDSGQLNALVRASLCSLPPLLYQDPLVQGWGDRVVAVATLDSRRRCIEVPRSSESRTQSSASSSSLSMG